MSGALDLGTLQGMVDLVDPAWTVRGATPAERGFCRVYRLRIEAPDAPRECFLKAPPEGAEAGIGADARLLAVLGSHTAIPVPAVLGVVDDHPGMPSPFYLMTPMAGCDRSYERVGWLPDDVLETLAREVGAYLGELHRLDAVDSFGYVDRDPEARLAGGRPSGTVADLAVRDGVDSWPSYLRRYVERELERHAETRFGGLTPRLETWCERRLDRLGGPFSPVLGRNDHGLHNLLVDPETGSVTAMLDWAYTLAVPPSFDLAFAAYLFSGVFLAGIPEVPDRRGLVRGAMRSGYRSTAPGLADAAFSPDPLYERLAAVRVMNDFERLVPKLPAGTERVVADGLWREVESAIADDRR